MLGSKEKRGPYHSNSRAMKHRSRLTAVVVTLAIGTLFQWTAAHAENLFGRISPSEIEDALRQRIAEQSDLNLTSLNSLSCDRNECSIGFSGLEARPRSVDEYSDLLSVLGRPPWEAFRLTSSSLGTREVSLGTSEYLIKTTYVALVDTSTDREIAARQYAACAGAWARMATQRGSKKYLRRVRQQSARWLERSASVLGMEEAQRWAEELQLGPLTADCQATPY